MDTIYIEELRARCILGLDAEERRDKQEVLINLALSADLSQAARSDAIADTVNYRDLKKRVLTMVEGSSYHLLEALAQHIAELCLGEPRVRKVKVRVVKPSALRFARTVAIELERNAPSSSEWEIPE